MARLLLFTTSKCQYENGNDNSSLMLIVTADAGKINRGEKKPVQKFY